MVAGWVRDAIPKMWLVVFFGLGLYALLWARREIGQEQDYQRDYGRVSVIMPEEIPALGQDSIDLAMALFSVTVGPNTDFPMYDERLEDRGLTSRGALSPQSSITIGAAAFSSWSLLGSTLAHEIEVHGRQNFLAISILDLLTLDGTGLAERQAYGHELAGAERFGLSLLDQKMIADTVVVYYPEDHQGPALKQLSARVQKWFSRNLLDDQARF